MYVSSLLNEIDFPQPKLHLYRSELCLDVNRTVHTDDLKARFV